MDIHLQVFSKFLFFNFRAFDVRTQSRWLGRFWGDPDSNLIFTSKSGAQICFYLGTKIVVFAASNLLPAS